MTAVSPVLRHPHHDHRRCAADALAHAEETARRETLEETGFEVALEHLLGAYRGTDDPRVRVVLLVYLARVVSGEGRAGDDAAELRVFSLRELPQDLAFRSHRNALDDYRQHLSR